MAVLGAGAVAMVLGASTFSWWRFTANEGLGLRELHVCAFAACKPYDYAAVVGVDHQTWVTLGLIACYGAFVAAGLGLIAVYAQWQKLAVSTAAARTTAIVALALLGVAIAFVVMRPDELNLSESSFQRARLYTRATTLGWSAIAYLGGAAAALIASATLSRRR